MTSPSTTEAATAPSGVHARSVAELSRAVLVAVYGVLAAVYLLWRVTATLNSEYPVYSVIFLAAEVLCAASALAFFYLIAGRVDPPHPGGLDRTPLVDVFIATYNEDADLVRTTAVAARDMDEPHRTWICDDGRRPEVEALARELGIGYITRSDNQHAKAGNLNNALARTDGEFVLVLDADHVPRRGFLTRVLGYFRDPNVAFVQTPQVFYNVDSYQHDLPGTGDGGLWHESMLFHHGIQPGAARLNAAFFVGTGAVLRRSALHAIGGFAQGTVTEDIHTSLRLHAAGYRAIYVDEPLAFLLAPDTSVAYAGQRVRWAHGAMQVLRTERALWRTGLTPAQRVGYLNALTVYLTAYYHLVFYLAPGLYLLTGIAPIASEPAVALPILLTRLAIDLALFAWLTRPHGRLLLSECFRILNVTLHIRASWALVAPGAPVFHVTPKGKHRGLPLALLVPTFALFAFNLTALGAAAGRLLGGAPDWPVVTLAAAFTAQFSIAGALALLHAVERRAADDHFMFPVSLPAWLGATREDSSAVSLVTVMRLNRKGAYVAGHQIPPGGDAWIQLGAAGIERAVHVEVEGRQRYRVGDETKTVARLSFLDLTASEGDLLDDHFFNEALPAFFAQCGASNEVAPTEIQPAEFLPIRGGIV